MARTFAWLRRFLRLSPLIAALVGYAYASYQRDMRDAYDRLTDFRRQSIDTDVGGRLEFVDIGDGEPLLLVHGGVGGFDQALELGRPYIEEGYRCIAPSRFGFLGSTVPDDASPASQADAFVDLLDHLGIEETAVLAWSSGGAAAVQLALRHPDRVSKLALISVAISPQRRMPLRPPKGLIRAVCASNLLHWLVIGPLRPLIRRAIIPGSYHLTVTDRRVVRDVFKQTSPLSPRTEGIVNDVHVTLSDQHRHPDRYRFEGLETPTLLVTSMDDPLIRFDDIEWMYDRLPRARLVTIDHGGHLLLGSSRRVQETVHTFLEQTDDDQFA